MNKYREAVKINCIVLLVLGMGWLYVMYSKGDALLQWLVALWALPLVNALYGVWHMAKGRWRLVIVYGILTMVFLVVPWIMWMSVKSALFPNAR